MIALVLSYSRWLVLFCALQLLTPPGAAARVEFEWVVVDDVGNPCDSVPWTTLCIGRVDYPYRISKYEVTNAQYAEFLNAVGAVDGGFFRLHNTGGGGVLNPIVRSLSSGVYTYSVTSGYENEPVNFVSFVSVARFVNWLENGQPTGPRDSTTTEDGSYVVVEPNIFEYPILAMVTV